MDNKRIADYFAVCGVPENKTDRTSDGLHRSNVPISDICVINKSEREPIPEGFEIIDKTINNHDANLNHGSYVAPNMYICVKRSRDKPPLNNINVYYEAAGEKLEPNVTVIRKTPNGLDANVNNSQSKMFLTYQRSAVIEPCNQLVVTDVRVILQEKNEVPPHAYMKINKNLNKGLFGSSVYLCYKLSLYEPPYIRYDPVLLDRYPLEDYSRFPIPDFLPNFCLPRGAAIQCWPGNTVSMSKPKSLNFVLTSELGDKMYVSTISFYDQISPLELTVEELALFGFKHSDENINKKFYRTKAICFISRYPFLEQFRKFGLFLVESFATDKMPKKQLSLESYVYRFMEDIPFPKPDLPNIRVEIERNPNDNDKSSLEDRGVTFSQTFDDLPFFSCGANFGRLLLNLGPENCLYILLFALTEQKILLHTLRPGILAEVTEAITTIIFPFNWHCPYIPLCPMKLYSVVHAPLPFIIGIDSGYFDEFEPPEDVVSIDLDTKSIYVSEKKHYLNLNILPKKELKQLKTKLEDLYIKYQQNKASSDSYNDNKRRYDIECQEAFLYFMASLLKDFKNYLKPITAVPKVGATDPKSLFHMNGFLKSRDSASQTFYKALLKTQMFTKFIEERCLVSDKNISLAFFDECVDKVERYERGLVKTMPTLIEIDDQQRCDVTHIISLEDVRSDNENGENSELSKQQQEAKKKQTLPVPGIGVLDHKQFFMLRERSSRKSFHSIATTATSSSSGRDSIDSSAIYTDLLIYPLVKRTKYEIKKASKYSEKVRFCPVERTKHLLMTTYGLWFTHFPAFSHYLRESNIDSLDLAFQVLKRMHSMHFSTSDEFCYRILMVLCSVYNRPALAVKILLHTKKIGVSMNAITYGYYNKAVLESNWSENCQRNNKVRWKVLLNVFSVVNYMNKKFKRRTDSHSEYFDNENDLVRDQQQQQQHHDNNVDSDEQTTEVCDKTEMNEMSTKEFSIKTIKDEQIEAHIVVSDGESAKAETNSVKSEDSFNDTFSTRFTTPIKDVWTNMDLFSNKSKVGLTLRSSFRFAKTKFGHNNNGNKRDDFTTPTKTMTIPKSQTFDDGQMDNIIDGQESQSGTMIASAGTTPNTAERPFIPTNVTSNNNTNNQSPWTAKHSEYVYSTFKSAANRFIELKGQFASNSINSPAKGQFLSSNLLSQFKNFSLDKYDLGIGGDQISDTGIVLTKPDDVLNNLSDYRDLFDTAGMFYLGPILEPPVVDPKIVLLIEMTTAYICSKCDSIVYDEEIMSGFGSLDSDMDTRCPKCDTRFVPHFTIFVKDFRKPDGSIDSENYTLLEPINLPYISPMALRKELESILSSEGYSCLLDRKFIDEHGIVYWNLLWYLQRINLPTHISGLTLLSDKLRPEIKFKEDDWSYLNVKIDCRWDHYNFYKHESCVPKHYKWLELKNGKSDPNFEEDVRQLLEKIREQDFGPAIRYLISKRVVSESKSGPFPSIYRDLFFLTVMELDIPLDVFDKLYCDAFNELSDKERELIQKDDSPPDVFAIFCRSLFKQLTLT